MPVMRPSEGSDEGVSGGSKLRGGRDGGDVPKKLSERGGKVWLERCK